MLNITPGLSIVFYIIGAEGQNSSLTQITATATTLKRIHPWI
jgi:hypothetical protein